MIQPDLLGRLRLLAEAYRIPVPSAAERVNEPTPVGPVRPVDAEVEARLPDGRFRVFAAGQRFDVALPASTQPGDRVQVSVPVIRSDAASAAARGTAPGAEPAAVDAQLSAAGRFITQLAGSRPDEQAPGAMPAAQPLLPDAPVDAAVAAATLRELVALSGLFYESHQAEWVNNARETAQLLREPQGRFSPALAPESPAAAPPAGPAPAAPPQAQAAPAASPGAEQPAPPQLPIHPDAAPIVQQQLNALEARHIVWSGQIWPGQAMRWEIEESEERMRESGAEDTGRVWQTRIELVLPRLGRVEALVALGPAGLGIRLGADSAATDALFGDRLAELRAALAAAGLPAATIARESHARP